MKLSEGQVVIQTSNNGWWWMQPSTQENRCKGICISPPTDPSHAGCYKVGSVSMFTCEPLDHGVRLVPLNEVPEDLTAIIAQLALGVIKIKELSL